VLRNSNTFRDVVAGILALLFTLSPASGQEKQGPGYTFRVNSDLVLVNVVVRDKSGALIFLDQTAREIPGDIEAFDDFLAGLRCDRVIPGFTHPCIHRAEILREVGGYDTRFLRGKQCFEDDSLLLGYYYYYGSKADWHPKVNYNSVVYHAVALQRLDLHDSIMPNYNGLVAQYGAMGLKSLSHLHQSAWHKRFFGDKFNELLSTQIGPS
jgi:hypothetical protein